MRSGRDKMAGENAAQIPIDKPKHFLRLYSLGFFAFLWYFVYLYVDGPYVNGDGSPKEAGAKLLV